MKLFLASLCLLALALPADAGWHVRGRAVARQRAAVRAPAVRQRVVVRQRAVVAPAFRLRRAAVVAPVVVAPPAVAVQVPAPVAVATPAFSFRVESFATGVGGAATLVEPLDVFGSLGTALGVSPLVGTPFFGRGFFRPGFVGRAGGFRFRR